ncbi:EAL domain-containing protein [Kordiimonas marina]|uniref:EAL domain-containing protein n=1 Tax=Kordiimonas marina TaxID=2872312 RepID=UPI001FF5D433|nr:EAL domain-containing protein [Kordiimonas marina]MCJ9428276.1 EAL domain-containing protein [Kordiimonas marina]
MTGQMEELKKERERFVAFAFAAAEIFFEIDKDGLILFEGGAVERIGAKPGASLVGGNIFNTIDSDDRDVFAALLLHLTHKGRIGPIPIRFIAGSGRNHALRLFALRMPDADGRIFLALRAAPLGSSSRDDGMDRETGLLSQQTFMDLASRTMKENPAGNNLYMTAVEVEGLDEARQKFGPQYMRALLHRVAAHLKTLSVDGELAGQIGDRHFAFLHRAKADGSILGDSLGKVDENVRLKTAYSTLASDTQQISEDQVLRTLSYILAKFCEDPGSVSFDRLSAAYDDMASATQRRVSSIRSMIETGTFKIAFQPVMSLTTGEVHHNEVLSRFDDGIQDGTPTEIIRFAEDVGMIEEFDLAVCRKATDYIRKMKKLGTPLKLALNISGRTLDSGRYVDQLVKLLSQSKDVSRSILLELTETTAIKNLDTVQGILNDIKAMGYHLCLDDFGAGASGYQYLRAFNVDYVKIDGSYVEGMAEPEYSPTFLLSIVRLCADLGIKTIGEHVETQYQADFLRSLNVDFGQGFYFGKPDFSPKTE